MRTNRPPIDAPAPPAGSPVSSIAALRREMGLTLADFAARLGMTAGHMSMVERGGPCSLNLALALEELSGGRLDAARLNADVARARRAPTAAAGSAAGAPGDAVKVTCITCDRATDSAAARDCQMLDCPNAEREAA